MADNRVSEAVDAVARWVLAASSDQVRRSVWRDGRDFSEADFEAVDLRVAAIADCPSFAEYEAACDFLTARKDVQP